MEKSSGKIIVDWNKVESIVERNGVNLNDYKGSASAYLSEKTGMPWSTLDRIKTSQSTKLTTLCDLADALHCNPVEILTVEGFEPVTLTVG